jgi:hypothetical protein
MRGFVPQNSNDFVYLASLTEIQDLDNNFEKIDVDDMVAASEKKLSFMRAFLAMEALEYPDFEAYVQTILKLQSRDSARQALGFWFWQSDIEKFGAGGFSFFQGTEISIFCENPTQIDFADITGILPYDCVTVRHPTKKWTKSRAQKLVDHIKWDLSFDGMETEIDFNLSQNFLFLYLLSPDYGIGYR